MKTIFKKVITTILTWEARLVLRKYKPQIVAVTGNVGKTSTKDAIFSVLSHVHYVRKSEKSFNSDIGVPLTILGLPNAWNNPFAWISNIISGLGVVLLKNHYPKWLVLEVGADRPGDIKRITRWLTPDVVVVTRIGEVPVHVEYFNSAEEVAREKRYLVEALKPEGVLALDMDNPFLSFMKEKSKSRTITFGSTEEAEMYASYAQIVYTDDGKPEGMTFKANYGGTSVPVRIHGTVGSHVVRPVLAAFAVAVHEHINLVSAVEWIGDMQTPPGRLKIVEGKAGSSILDDSYNASPDATRAALETLGSIETSGRKIAVLGDMLELGKHSTSAHEFVGEQAAQCADELHTVGVRMVEAAEIAKQHGLPTDNIYTHKDASEAGDMLERRIQQNDIVLIKGSQSMRMERIVERLMAHPEQRAKLLVRQDADWLAKP